MCTLAELSAEYREAAVRLRLAIEDRQVRAEAGRGTRWPGGSWPCCGRCWGKCETCGS